MKKLLVLLSVFLVIFGLGMQTAGAEEVLESSYITPAETTVNITPTIQINEPGTIAVKITWTTPQLTFIRKVRAIDGLAYYALQSNVNTAFTVTNNSRPSSSGTFNGDISVKASKFEGLADGTALQRKNFKIILNNDNVAQTLLSGAEDKESFVLSYTNRDESYLQDLGMYPANSMLTADMGAAQIVKNMTVAVRFNISDAP